MCPATSTAREIGASFSKDKEAILTPPEEQRRHMATVA